MEFVNSSLLFDYFTYGAEQSDLEFGQQMEVSIKLNRMEILVTNTNVLKGYLYINI